MLASKLKRNEKRSLSQGMIFEIPKLKLKFDNTKKTIKELYPEASLDNVNYGLILTQSCDLVHDKIFEQHGGLLDKSEKNNYKYRLPKIPHITFCLLEPINSFISEFLSKNESKFLFKTEDTAPNNKNTAVFSSRKALKLVLREFDKFFQNNHPWAFFITIQSKGRREYYFVNLTKILPLRIVHYKSILQTSRFQLTNEFSNKLAWKLATLYGRIGTQDYSTKAITEIIEDILGISQKEFFNLSGQFININPLDFDNFKKNLGRHHDLRRRNKILQDLLEEHSITNIKSI